MVAQFIRPDADDVDGGWTNEVGGTTLFGSVDESSFSDTDYIKSSGLPNDKVKLRLSDPTATVAEPLIIRFRCRHEIAGDANLIARLFEGTTQITWFQLTITDTFTTYTHQLNSAEFASIGDFTNLFIEFESNPDIQTFGWGNNHWQKSTQPSPYGGQLALGDLIERSSPVQIINGFNFDSFGTGCVHSLGIRDGKLYAWGNNFVYALGLGDGNDRSSPCQVGSLTTWKQVSGGQYFSAGVTIDGKIYTWGRGSYGRLGHGNITNISIPTQVGAGTDWAFINCGYSFTFGIKTNGKLYAWGRNTWGQLGLNDVVHRSSPVQVGAGTNWAKVIGGFHHSFAITTDGKLYSWGNNLDGQLGHGDNVHRSVPVQVGAKTDWTDVTTSFGFFAAGLDSSGRMWGWGADAGQLGMGPPTGPKSPVQIWTGRRWKKISVPSADFTLLAIDTEGKLWASGTSRFGELGIGIGGIGVRISSPVQVGTLTTWTDVNCGYYWVFGRRT